MVIDVIKYIRQLAKSDYYQTIYSASKECGIKLFQNNFDLTQLQVRFLRYLGFYASINMDISLGDVDEKILDNEIYEDSYMLFRNRKDSKNLKKQKTEIPGGVTQWVFPKPPKK